jgi:hypothetical protein
VSVAGDAPRLVVTISVQGDNTSTRIQVRGATMEESLRLAVLARDALTAEIEGAGGCPAHRRP